jgi:ketosteroid isomerase-like protein
MRNRLARLASLRRIAGMLAVFLVFSVSASLAYGQNQKKKKNNNDPPAQPANTVSTPDTEQIDHDIGEMLAAFQLGRVDMMHKYYSDHVTVVSGAYEPPIIGWSIYAPLYQRQWAAFQSMQLNRRNTLIFTHGDVAWATYQWEFNATAEGQPYSLRGQTTLVFNKVGDDWLIVHNHTSESNSQQTQQPAAQPQPQVPAGSKP